MGGWLPSLMRWTQEFIGWLACVGNCHTHRNTAPVSLSHTHCLTKSTVMTESPPLELWNCEGKFFELAQTHQGDLCPIHREELPGYQKLDSPTKSGNLSNNVRH